MGQGTDSEEDIVDDIDLDDEEWDDLDDGFESFEETGSSADEDNKKASKPEKANLKPKKKSGTGLLMGLMAIATLGSVSWLALGNNPQIMSLILGMTSGEKITQNPTVALDQPEAELSPPADTQSQAPAATDIPAFDQSTAAPEPAGINIDGSIDSAPVINDNPAPSSDIAAPEDGGVLTPLPELSDLEQEPAPAVLSSQEDAPEEQATAIPDIEESIPSELVTTEDSPAVSLEEEKLLEQTEKTLNTVQEETTAAEPLPSYEIPPLNAKEPSEEITIDSSALPSVDEFKPAASEDSLQTHTTEITAKAENIIAPEEPLVVASAEPEEPEQPEASKKNEKKSEDLTVKPSDSDVSKEEPTETLKKPVESNTSKSTEKKAPSAVQEKPKTLPVWELRSASMGSAVIHDKKTGNVFSIGVGSSVNGIGRVKSIEQHNGKWRVTGTTGSIHQ